MTSFFFHIPKTGGTSFKRVLERWFRTQQDEAISADELRELERSRPADLCIHGHFSGLLRSSNHALLTRYPWIVANPAAQVFTFLRHPVEQAVSLYYHERLAGRAVGTLMDFLQTPHTFAAARALEITQQHEILPALQSFAFVGITDELQASADRLAQVLGKPHQLVPYERVAERDEQIAAVTGSERRRLENLYPLEFELYERARESVMAGERITWQSDCQFDFLQSRASIRSEVFVKSPALVWQRSNLSAHMIRMVRHALVSIVARRLAYPSLSKFAMEVCSSSLQSA